MKPSLNHILSNTEFQWHFETVSTFHKNYNYSNCELNKELWVKVVNENEKKNTKRQRGICQWGKELRYQFIILLFVYDFVVSEKWTKWKGMGKELCKHPSNHRSISFGKGNVKCMHKSLKVDFVCYLFSVYSMECLSRKINFVLNFQCDDVEDDRKLFDIKLLVHQDRMEKNKKFE